MTDAHEPGHDDRDSTDRADVSSGHRDGGNVVPLRRAEASTTGPDGDAPVWRVERVETAPMTPEQYHDAVRAFSALVRQWLAQQPATNSDDAERLKRPNERGNRAA